MGSGLRFFERYRFLIAILFLVGCSVIGCAKSSSEQATRGKKSTTSGPSDPAFRVPEGTPDELLRFLKKLRETHPKFSNSAEMKEYQQKLIPVTIEATDKILAQNAADEVLSEAARMRLNSAIVLALSRFNPNQAPTELAREALDVVNRLKADPRPVVASAAEDYRVPASALNLASMTDSERRQLSDDAMKRVIDSKGSQRTVADIGFLVDQLIATNQNELAADGCQHLADWLNSLPEGEMKSQAAYFQGRATRLKLPGSEFQLDGKLLDGSEFDWKSYRGKVVLVEFWATWCGPCVAELPSVQATYNKYHSQGLEIVGISLDRDRKRLEAFLTANSIPWAQIFFEQPSGSTNEPNPLAIRYSVHTIPETFLIDREGKVISTDARGNQLQELLKKLFKS